MVFSTNVFLFLFLPIFLGVYYLLPFRFRSAWILVASYAFYAWWRLDFVALFFLTTLFSYFVGQRIAHTLEANPARARRWLAAGVVGNLGVLAYFKYFNFGLDSFNVVLDTLGGRPISAWQVILPIGISFYVFQATSYVIDVYRRDAPPAKNFWDLSAFIALFPQLIAGPILRYKDLAGQFEARRHTFEKFSEGAARFMVGFCKKVLVADTVAPVADRVFALSSPSFSDAWLGTFAYTLQLYFDFSGYSDMAIGLGLMMGFRFMENFNHPYISRSITEFWQRWHISLSTWLRDYLYIPLGGNRKGMRRTYVNLGMVMLLGGLWHGANWTFVLWGLWHGGILALERLLGAARLWRPVPPWLAVPRTLLLVMIGWVVFRATNLSASLSVYAGMLGLNGTALSESLVWRTTGLQTTALLVATFLVFAAPLWRSFLAHVSPSLERRWVTLHLLILPLFVLGIFRLSAQSFSPFLYFQF